MNILEKCEAHEHKAFGGAAALYLAELTGKCKGRQECALNQVLPCIEEAPLLEICDETLWEFKYGSRGWPSLTLCSCVKYHAASNQECPAAVSSSDEE